jgi:dTDP-4-amino-4,6-dideoxygalactose transaminase
MPIGSHGNYCVFSFQAIKHLTTGDGGLLCTPDAETYRRAKLLRWYGIDRESKADFRCEGDIEEWGYKFHMNDINAAIGLSNLTDIDATLNAHRENARFYQLRLRDIPGVRLLNEDTDRSSAYWLFTLRASNRAGLAMKLKERGIACGQVHKRNDKYTCTARFDRGDLPGTDTFEREMLCIPVGWWVTPEDRDHIASSISEGW